MIGSIYLEIARFNWATVPGRTIDMVNDTDGNPTKITFSENGTVVYAQYLTYTNKAVTKVECKAE